MEIVELGKTSLKVTKLCFGTAAIGNMPDVFGFPVSPEQSQTTIKAFFESPLNFIDTSNLYGRAEQDIGKVLKEIGGLPSGFVLQTKADRNPITQYFSGEQIKRSIETSLNRLGLDKLQMVYIHDPEHTTFENVKGSGGPLEVLMDFKRQGIIDHIGISGGPIDMLIQYVNTEAFEPVITHSRYNLLYRVADPLLNIAHQRGLGVINASPFAGGLLADPNKKIVAYQEASADLIERVDKMRAICEKYNVSLKAAALHFSLRDPRIHSTIIGPANSDQLSDSIQLMQEKVPDEIWEELAQYAIFDKDPEENRFK